MHSSKPSKFKELVEIGGSDEHVCVGVPVVIRYNSRHVRLELLEYRKHINYVLIIFQYVCPVLKTITNKWYMTSKMYIHDHFTIW